MRPYRIQIYQAADGWRWRIKAGNNRIVADSGEAYSSKLKAARSAENLVYRCGLGHPWVQIGADQ